MDGKKSPFFQFPENFIFIKGNKDPLGSENFILLSLLLLMRYKAESRMEEARLMTYYVNFSSPNE